jgi:hypothetical protein
MIEAIETIERGLAALRKLAGKEAAEEAGPVLAPCSTCVSFKPGSRDGPCEKGIASKSATADCWEARPAAPVVHEEAFGTDVPNV